MGFEGEKIDAKVTITALKDQILDITDVICDIKDKIKYKLKTVKKGKEYTIKVKNRSNHVGFFRGKIVLKTNYREKPDIVLHIDGVLREEVLIRPKSVSFGNLNTSKDGFNPERLTKKIVLRDVRGDGMIIKKIKPSKDWILTEIEKRERDKYYSILITLDKGKLPRGHFEEKVKICTNYKKKCIVVNMKGEVI